MGKSISLKYKEGRIKEDKDADGFWHKFECRDGIIYHTSNRPMCRKCWTRMDIIKWEYGYAEICPDCGQGFGSIWS